MDAAPSWVAIVALIVACCDLTWLIVTYLLERGRIKLSPRISIESDILERHYVENITVSVTNVGRHPVTVVGMGTLWRDPPIMFNRIADPDGWKVLAPGGAEPMVFKPEDLYPLARVRGFYARDSSGRRYRCTRFWSRDLRRVLNHKVWAEHWRYASLSSRQPK